MTALDDIVTEIRNGIDLEQSDRPLDRNMLPISRIETISEGVIDFSRVKYVTPTLRDRQKYQLQSGDILFSHINSPEHIGKTGLFRSNKPLLHGINLLLLRVDKAVCHPEYLNFYLKSFAVRARFRTRCKRAVNQASLNQDDILSLEVPVPDLPDQKRIAALLEKADRLRRTRRYARQLSDTFLQSVFVERFGKNESCDRRMIRNLLDDGAIRKIEDGNHGEIHPRAADFVKKGTPFLTATNVIDDQVLLERAPRISAVKAARLRIGWIQPDDVLLSHNATVGRVAIVPKFKGKVVIGTSLTFYRVNQKEFTPEFFAEALRARSFQAQLEKAMEQTTRNQVPVSRQKELLIPVPPLPLQQKFADIVRRFERLRSQQREAERQAEHLFQTLLHRAFSGEITSAN